MAIFDTFKGGKEEGGDAAASASRGTRKDGAGAKKRGSAAVASVDAASSRRDPNMILLRPHITEKSSQVAQHNVYTFQVPDYANKNEVKKAVKFLYDVEPVRVRTVRLPAKRITSRRGEQGVTGVRKKALVYLKEGDTIEFI